MKKQVTLVAAAALGLVFVQASAVAQQKGEAAAKAAGCLNCHGVDAKKAGPALKDVGAKAGSADKVLAGMKAKPVHQAAFKSVKEPDLNAIAQWVASLGK